MARELSSSAGDVHDEVAEREELVRGHRLGEEVGGVVVRLDQRDDELERLDHVAHVEVAALDVLEPDRLTPREALDEIYRLKALCA